MNKRFYWNMAFDGLKKNKKIIFPYLITCIMTTSMFYIMNSLSYNTGFESMIGGETVQTLMLIGRNIIGIFSIVFLIYTNSFLIKNRKKEFGLYHILGMEKKHIIKMISYEWIQTTVLSIGVGLIVGFLLDKVMFLILLRLMKQKIIFGFYVGKQAVFETILFFIFIHSILLINTIRMIFCSKTIELLYGGVHGEKEPKNKWWITLIGIICIGVGYIFSIKTTNLLQALPVFFLAVLLVMIGTYCIFISGTITLLKILKANRNYYYKPNHFISVSTMMYRMKKNGIGLANICILSTMVLIALSTTISLWSGIQDILQLRYPKEFMISCETSDTNDGKEKELYLLDQQVQSIVKKYDGKEIEKEAYLSLNMTVIKSENQFDYIGGINENLKDIYYLSAMTIDDYNQCMGTDYRLKENEVLFYGNDKVKNNSQIFVLYMPFQIKEQVEKIPSVQGLLSSIPTYGIVVSSEEQLQLLEQKYNEYEDYVPVNIKQNISFDLKATKDGIQDIFKEIQFLLKQQNLVGYVESKSESKSAFYTLYSGFLFLGVFLSILFLGAMILIMYYKQIAEGYEDQNSFQILQKVGMDRYEIQKIIESQMLTVFFLPLVLAGIHTIFAFPIVSRLLQMLYLENLALFVRCTCICFLCFSILYFFVYKMTSKMYYKIVK